MTCGVSLGLVQFSFPRSWQRLQRRFERVRNERAPGESGAGEHRLLRRCCHARAGRVGPRGPLLGPVKRQLFFTRGLRASERPLAKMISGSLRKLRNPPLPHLSLAPPEHGPEHGNALIFDNCLLSAHANPGRLQGIQTRREWLRNLTADLKCYLSNVAGICLPFFLPLPWSFLECLSTG